MAFLLYSIPVHACLARAPVFDSGRSSNTCTGVSRLRVAFVTLAMRRAALCAEYSLSWRQRHREEHTICIKRSDLPAHAPPIICACWAGGRKEDGGCAMLLAALRLVLGSFIFYLHLRFARFSTSHPRCWRLRISRHCTHYTWVWLHALLLYFTHTRLTAWTGTTCLLNHPPPYSGI